MWTSDELRDILEARYGENVVEAAIRVKQENLLLRTALTELGIFIVSPESDSDIEDYKHNLS